MGSSVMVGFCVRPYAADVTAAKVRPLGGDRPGGGKKKAGIKRPGRTGQRSGRPQRRHPPAGRMGRQFPAGPGRLAAPGRGSPPCGWRRTPCRCRSFRREHPLKEPLLPRLHPRCAGWWRAILRYNLRRSCTSWSHGRSAAGGFRPLGLRILVCVRRGRRLRRRRCYRQRGDGLGLFLAAAGAGVGAVRWPSTPGWGSAVTAPSSQAWPRGSRSASP